MWLWLLRKGKTPEEVAFLDKKSYTSIFLEKGLGVCENLI